MAGKVSIRSKNMDEIVTQFYYHLISIDSYNSFLSSLVLKIQPSYSLTHRNLASSWLLGWVFVILEYQRLGSVPNEKTRFLASLDRLLPERKVLRNLGHRPENDALDQGGRLYRNYLRDRFLDLEHQDPAQAECCGNWKQLWGNCNALADFSDCSRAVYGPVCV